MKFTKMHGLGNDYVYVNCFEQEVNDPQALAVLMSDRHMGIGADGLILICSSKCADARMRIFNADGSEAEMCGNGLRCVAKYVYNRHLAQSRGPFSLPGQSPCCNASLLIETGSGILSVGLSVDQDDNVEDICVNMGEPILEPSRIPVNIQGNKVINVPLDIGGSTWRVTCVSMGNPHAVIYVENVDAIALETLGPQCEHHTLFPNRTNVHFVQVLSPTVIKIRTWERGSGITLACGTGACACCVAGVLTGKNQRECIAHLPGGALQLHWIEQDNNVYMTGPAVEVFTGTWVSSR
jgi:diaminopimelate epimerase